MGRDGRSAADFRQYHVRACRSRTVHFPGPSVRLDAFGHGSENDPAHSMVGESAGAARVPVWPVIYTEPDMTMEANPDTVVARQVLDLRTTASTAPLPSPEAVFVDWLLWLPRGANLRAAARLQIALIDRHASVHPDVQVLRTLLAAVAGEGTWRKPFTNL